MYAAGKPTEGRRLDVEQVDPAYERLARELGSAITRYKNFDDTANALGRLFTIVVILSAGAITALLLARTERARRREDASAGARSALAASEARFRSLVENSSDVIFVVRPDRSIAYQSPSSAPIFGYGESELLGTDVLDLVHPAVAAQLVDVLEQPSTNSTVRTLETRLLHHDGSWRYVEVVVARMSGDAELHGMILNCRDIEDRKRLEADMVHQALHDGLTGLANRTLFRDRVSHSLAGATRDGSSGAVMVIDVDDFKAVNDTLGHQVGDQVLMHVAVSLQQVL
ncbi:MAG: PAS domain S-box protein [Candidatus Dormibacteria bacterium]